MTDVFQRLDQLLGGHNVPLVGLPAPVGRRGGILTALVLNGDCHRTVSSSLSKQSGQMPTGAACASFQISAKLTALTVLQPLSRISNESPSLLGVRLTTKGRSPLVASLTIVLDSRVISLVSDVIFSFGYAASSGDSRQRIHISRDTQQIFLVPTDFFDRPVSVPPLLAGLIRYYFVWRWYCISSTIASYVYTPK